MSLFAVLDSNGVLSKGEKDTYVFRVPVGTEVTFCMRFNYTVSKYIIDLKKYETDPVLVEIVP